MHRKLRISKRSKGLTLIEVVIAAALLAIVLVPILRSLTIAHASTVKVEHKSRSLILAQAKLEEIRARSIYDYTNGGNSFAESDTVLDGSYLCNVTDDADDRLKTIAVSVGFDTNSNGSLSGDEVNITLTTLIARRWVD
jgi:prepilin-type N-terminal cleavage/methylation domain-containing protein